MAIQSEFSKQTWFRSYDNLKFLKIDMKHQVQITLVHSPRSPFFAFKIILKKSNYLCR